MSLKSQHVRYEEAIAKVVKIKHTSEWSLKELTPIFNLQVPPSYRLTERQLCVFLRRLKQHRVVRMQSGGYGDVRYIITRC